MPISPTGSGVGRDLRFEHDACGVGFIADLSGRHSHGVVSRALNVLRHLEHRGARGGDPGTGDGAGILTRLPDEFFRAVSGLAFISAEQSGLTRTVETLAAAEGLKVLGWRDVPRDVTYCGAGARAVLPELAQVFVAGANGESGLELERRAFCLRKRAEHQGGLYFASLSARTIVYKGRIQLRLPRIVLISPLCATYRYGWASGQDGNVL